MVENYLFGPADFQNWLHKSTERAEPGLAQPARVFFGGSEVNYLTQSKLVFHVEPSQRYGCIRVISVFHVELGCSFVMGGIRLFVESRKKVRMDFVNAFIGRKTQPTAKDLAAALGDSLGAWKKLTGWLTSKDISTKEWHSVSPKYGWALRPQLKSRNILYMAPCSGCFRVSLVLGDRAVAAACASDLPKAILQEIAGSKRYAEGTGVRLLVTTSADLAPVRTLVEIKLQN
jgi:hypothetical protein